MRVIVNVYDVQKTCNQKGGDFLGLGIYHTGVEIEGIELSYGGNTMVRSTGVYENYPWSNLNFHYKYCLDLGEIDVKELRISEFKLKNSINKSQPESN